MLSLRGNPAAFFSLFGPDLCEFEYFGGRNMRELAQTGDVTGGSEEQPGTRKRSSGPPKWLEVARDRAHAVLAVRSLLYDAWSPDHAVEDGAYRLYDQTIIHVKDGVLHNAEGPAIKYPNGAMVYYRNGFKSRDKGAAVIAANGSRAYLVDGALHRRTGPAIITASGHREFWRDGLLDRKNRPAIIYPDGTVEFAEKGVTGRKRAPTIIRSDGTKKYNEGGVLHNESGPAVSQGLVRREWWRDGRNLEDDSKPVHCGIDEFDMRLFNQQLQDTLFVKEVFPGSALWTLARRRIAATAASER